jgi:hypothetical protein
VINGTPQLYEIDLVTGVAAPIDPALSSDVIGLAVGYRDVF